MEKKLYGLCIAVLIAGSFSDAQGMSFVHALRKKVFTEQNQHARTSQHYSVQEVTQPVDTHTYATAVKDSTTTLQKAAALTAIGVVTGILYAKRVLPRIYMSHIPKATAARILIPAAAGGVSATAALGLREKILESRRQDAADRTFLRVQRVILQAQREEAARIINNQEEGLGDELVPVVVGFDEHDNLIFEEWLNGMSPR